MTKAQTKTSGAVYWLGDSPARCDICGQPIRDEFVDGKTKQGPWGILHPECHKRVGVGLGTGMGQLYAKQKDGRWLKTGG